MKSYKTTAINLKSNAFSEADKLVVLFSKDFGKIRCVAKGARKAKSKHGGRLEPFAYNSYLLSGGKSLDIITQSETIESFSTIRQGQDQIKVAAYISRFLNHWLEERHPHENLFNLCYHCLSMLQSGFSPKLVESFFEVKFMKLEGLAPVLDGCVSCGQKEVQENSWNFSFKRSGIICSSCSKKESNNITLSKKELDYLSFLHNITDMKQLLNVGEKGVNLDRLLSPYLMTQLQKETYLMKSYKW